MKDGMYPAKLISDGVPSNLIWTSAAIFLLIYYLTGLDQSLLFDVDEGAFSEATREMLISRDWWHTTLNGVDRFDKPIGVYWLQALSAHLFGISEFAFRLPSALSGWISSLALAMFAKERWGHKAGILALVISATSLGPWAMARTATADALLGLFFVLIFIDLYRALETRNLFFSRRLSVWVALGLLVKGPVAVVVPLGTLVIYAWMMPSSRSAVKLIFSDLWSWALLCAISMPWYFYAYSRHGQSFIDGFLLKHNVGRFTNSLEGHSGSWAYFIVALPLLWMPWFVMWLRSLLNLRSQWQNPLLKFAWIWFFFVFLFFSLANTKLPHYLLYAGPAMCLLITKGALLAGKRAWALTWMLALMSLTCLLFMPGYLQNHTEMIHNKFYQQLMSHSETTQMWKWLLALPVIFVLAIFLNACFRNLNIPVFKESKLFYFSAFVFFQNFILAWVVLPWWSNTLQSPVHALAVNLKNRPETIVQWGVHFPSFAVYREQEAPRRVPLSGELALVNRMQSVWPKEWQIIETSGPLAVVKSPESKSPNP